MDLFKKKWFWGVVIGLVVIVLVLVNLLNTNGTAKVSTAEVTEGSIVEQVYTNGKLEAGETNSVYSPASGVVQAVEVKLGDTVKKGQQLLSLEMDQVKEQLDKEQINLQLTQAERLAAKKQHFESFKQAVGENPDQEMEELDLTSFDLRIRSSELTIQSLNKQLANSSVLVPADGVITALAAEAGQMLAEGTALATIADVSSYKVTAYLNELDAGKVSEGMQAVVTGEAFEGEYEGKITYLSRTAGLADQTSKDTSVEMTVTLDKVSPELRAGYNVTVEMEIPDKERLLVPINAVQYDGEKAYVYKVEEGIATRVEVTTGKESEDQIELVTGAVSGDVIVTEGADTLHDGAKVETK